MNASLRTAHDAPSPRTLARLARLGLTIFLAAYVVAMALYPGGTWFDLGARGHRFWGNFFCDVQRAVALNGAPNRAGSLVGIVAAEALYASWVPVWLLVPRALGAGLAPKPSLRRAIHLGLAACVVALAVPLTPRALHAWVVLPAAAIGLVALAMVMTVLLASHASRALRTVTVLLALSGSANALLYAWSLTSPAVPALLPVVQKLAMFAMIAWMLLVTREATGATRSP